MHGANQNSETPRQTAPPPEQVQAWLALQGIAIEPAAAQRLAKTLGRLAPAPLKKGGA